MKKSIFLAALGLAIAAANSHGQGYVFFSSYTANNGEGATTSFFGGGLVPAGWTAGLYYALGTVSDPVWGWWGDTWSPPTGLIFSGITATYESGYAAGYFYGRLASIPGYTGGPITFEVVAYNGSSYDSSTARSRSGSFTMNSIALPGYPAPALGDNGQPMPNIIFYVPEPTTFTLMSLGGVIVIVEICHEKKRKTASATR
jgi:hypothetical protein